MTMEGPRIDDIGFEELVTEAKARIAVHNPDWTNHNDADPGITILQLFAFMTESLLYRANRIPERNRHKFLRLIGLEQSPATPARGIVTFDSSKGSGKSVTVPADAEVRAGSVPFGTTEAIDVLPVSAVVCAKTASTQELDEDEREFYLAMYKDRGYETNDVRLYDTTRVVAPAGATTSRPIDMAETLDQSIWVAILAPEKDAVDAAREQMVGRTLTIGILPDIEDASRVLAPRSTLRRIETPRVTVSIPDADGPIEGDGMCPPYRTLHTTECGDVLVEPGTITAELPTDTSALALWPTASDVEPGVGDYPPVLDESEAERLITWLRLRRPRSPADPLGETSPLSLPVSWLGINAVSVVQRRRVVREHVGRGNGQPDQTVQLGNTPILPETVELWVGGERWTRTDDVLAAPVEVMVGPGRTQNGGERPAAGDPRVFTATVDGSIRFGSGIHGARVPANQAIVASYSFGGGVAGQVPPGAISTALDLPAGVKVTNEIPTWGGADIEPLDAAERRMTDHVRHQDRAVTADDMVAIVERTPGVSIARCEVRPLYHPGLGEEEAPGIVTVMVIPTFDSGQPAAPRPNRMFLDTVCDHLDSRRLVTTEILVRGPEYVPVSVSVGFEPEQGRSIPPLREAISSAVKAFLSPIPHAGREGWRLRRPLDARDILAEAARVSGVQRVNGVELSVRDSPTAEPVSLKGLELPHLVGLSVQPGDPTPVQSLSGRAGEDPKVLPVPAIPEDC